MKKIEEKRRPRMNMGMQKTTIITTMEGTNMEKDKKKLS